MSYDFDYALTVNGTEEYEQVSLKIIVDSLGYDQALRLLHAVREAASAIDKD